MLQKKGLGFKGYKEQHICERGREKGAFGKRKGLGFIKQQQICEGRREGGRERKEEILVLGIGREEGFRVSKLATNM
jgi:hypothetical protein